jgi:co-chaperonin GroES (HSP10)
MTINTSGINPVGHRLLVLPEAVEEVTEGGIIIHVGNQKDREQLAQIRGTVVAMGSTAYADQKDAWCQVGDFITFGKYSGLIYRENETKDKKEYRVINDLDVVATHERESK